MLKLRTQQVTVGLFLTQIMMMHLRNINLRKNIANNVLNTMGTIDWRGFCRGGMGQGIVGGVVIKGIGSCGPGSVA